MGDAHGRWFSFAATAETIVCLEKQGLPEHLKQLPSIETPMSLQSLLLSLEDSGEAYTILSCPVHMKQKSNGIWGTSFFTTPYVYTLQR